MSDEQSLSQLESQAAARADGLSRSINVLRERLQPRSLADEASRQLQATSQDVLHKAAQSAESPAGIGIAAIAAGSSLAALFIKTRRDTNSDSPVGVAITSSPSPRQPRDMVRAAALIGTAACLGWGLSKLVPPTAKERQLIGPLGAELKGAFRQWTNRQVGQLVNVPGDKPMRSLNIIALAAGLVLGTRQKHRDRDLG